MHDNARLYNRIKIKCICILCMTAYNRFFFKNFVWVKFFGMFVKNALCIKTLSRFCTMHADYVILHTLIKYQSTFFFSI